LEHLNTALAAEPGVTIQYLACLPDNIPFIRTIITVMPDIIVRFAIPQPLIDPEGISMSIGYPVWWELTLGKSCFLRYNIFTSI